MSRNYAQIFTAIWRDKDFIALTRERQQAYFLLVTQPNISAAGVLPLTIRRWAKLSDDTTAAQLRADIQHLNRTGLVVVDEDAEELLVRSFVRHDNGYRNPRRQPSIRDAAREIASPRLRQALAVELVRLDCPEWLPEMADADLAAPTTVGDPSDAASSQVDSHSDSHSDPRQGIDGMASRSQTARTTTHNPQPRTHTLPAEGVTSAAVAAPTGDSLFAVPPSPRTAKTRRLAGAETAGNAGDVVAAFIEGAKERNRTVTPPIIKQVGATAKQLIQAGAVPHDQLVNAAREMGRKGWKDLNMQLFRGSEAPNGGGYVAQRVNTDKPGSHTEAWNRRRAQHAHQQ